MDKLLGSHGYFNLLAPTNAALVRSQSGSRQVRIPNTDNETTTDYSSGRLAPILERCVPHSVKELRVTRKFKIQRRDGNKTLKNTNLVAPRCFKMKKTSLPVAVRRSKTP